MYPQPRQRQWQPQVPQFKPQQATQPVRQFAPGQLPGGAQPRQQPAAQPQRSPFDTHITAFEQAKAQNKQAMGQMQAQEPGLFQSLYPNAGVDQDQLANQRYQASQQELLRRMGQTGFGVNPWGDPRAQGIHSTILSFYQPGHPQYEAELRNAMTLRGQMGY